MVDGVQVQICSQYGLLEILFKIVYHVIFVTHNRPVNDVFPYQIPRDIVMSF